MTVYETSSPWSSEATRLVEFGEALPAEGPATNFESVAPVGESPYGESAYGGSPFGEMPYSESLYSESPYGEAPYSEAVSGESPFNETPAFEAPAWEMPSSQAGPYDETPYSASYELESPFLSGAAFAGAPAGERGFADASESELESPFLTAAGAATSGELETNAFGELLAELEDEQFDAAVARLVDEAAALQLSSESSWSSAEAGSSLSMAELEDWIQPLANESDRMLGEMANRLAAEELETLRDTELESLLESMRPQTGLLPGEFENFLGGLFNKAKSFVTGAVNLAKKGIQAVGKILPIGFILEKLRGLVRPLLRQVLQRALGRLPVSIQPLARRLADRLLGEAGEAVEAHESEDGGLAREFDIRAAQLLFAADEQEAESMVLNAETESEAVDNGLGQLDTARARFAQQVTELPGGTAPVAELEQFIPAIMAVLPAIRLGLGVIGRDKVVNFLAEKIAGLISGVVGADAARQLAGPIVDVGLRMLNLEAPAAEGSALAGEAVASTVEDAVRHLLELPAEAFDDRLRLESEIQQAVAESAGRHIPAEWLRPDLPELESLAGGTWILMPRAARPAYRYRKFSRVFVVPVTRQMARALPTADGGTVETMLLDRGVRSWPAAAEVHLYETMPGTSLGHIGQFEAAGETAPGEMIGELQLLTPEAASLLVREPALGRAPGGHRHRHHHHRPALQEPGSASGSTVVSPGGAAVSAAAAPPGLPVARPVPPGVRLYRLNVPGVPGAAGRPHRRIHVRFEPNHRPPSTTVHVQLSEREGQEIAAKLQRRDVSGAFLLLRQAFHHVAPAVLTARLIRHGARIIGSPVPSETAVRLSLQMTEAMTQSLSAALSSKQDDFTRAVQDVRQGITVTFVFRAEQASWAQGRVTRPTVTVHAGWHG